MKNLLNLRVLAMIALATYLFQPLNASGGVESMHSNEISPASNEVVDVNNVYFFVGSPLAMIGATVELYDGNGYYQSFVTSDPWGGEFIADVPYGTYTYAVSNDCHDPLTGEVVVDFNNGDGISVFATPTPSTTNDVFFFVGSPMAMLGATVELYDGNGYYESFVTSDPWSGEFIADVPYGTYTYAVSNDCHETVSGEVVVECNGAMGISVFATPTPSTTNDVFFFVGSPMAMLGATVELYDGNGYYESFVTSDPWSGEFIADVPYGTYTYAVSNDCHETVSGEVVVECNGAMGISVFATPTPSTTNDVFFFVGSPMAMLGATVELYDGNGYYQSFVTSDPWGGEFIADVPYGTYTYAVSNDCHETVSGEVVVECNGAMGISVFATPTPSTTNDVFFFVGSPMAMLGATVELYDGNGYYESFVTSDPWSGEFIADVPYGTYTYAVSNDCHETVSGEVVVECNGAMGISVFATPTPSTTNDVFFFVGSPMAMLGATVELYDGNGYYESFVTSDPWSGEFIADVPYGTYTYAVSNDCHETVSGEVVVECNGAMGISVFATPTPSTTNDVFFFVGSPMAMLGATVELYDGNGYYESFVTSDPWSGEFIADVPYGTYTYAVSNDCHETVSGEVVVECNGAMGISVFATPTPSTTNDVFFFVGSPMAMLGATVELYDGNGYYESFVTSDPWSGEFIADVPYGTYTYAVSNDCHETVSGEVVVECNGAMGISVFATPTPSTTNDVFFFVGSPMAMLGATVELYDGNGYYESFVTSDPWSGEFIADVPYGTYTYAVSNDCHETVSGEVVVECNGAMGISVFATPTPSTTNDVFFFVGSPMAMLGATVELYDGNGYYESFVTSDPWSGEFIADVPYGTYTYAVSNDCHETVSGEVVVECNGAMGISVFATPAPLSYNATVTESNGVLFAEAGDWSYQWVDCNDNNAAVLGGTGATFAPSTSGTYAVLVGGAECGSMSDCTTVNVNEGCTYSDADNYDATATIDDGSCTFEINACPGDLNGDSVIGTPDLLQFLSLFGSSCE